MDALIKAITAVLPFLAQCPPAVRLLAILWAAFTGVLIVVILACILWPSSTGPTRLPSVTAHPPPSSVDIVILQPTPNEEVEEGAMVEFRSVHSELYHYVVVIPMRSPNRWVVDGPLRVLRDGSGTGRARFGSGPVGVGEQFAIAVLASAVLLPEGVLANLPVGSQLSQHVTVKRVR